MARVEQNLEARRAGQDAEVRGVMARRDDDSERGVRSASRGRNCFLPTAATVLAGKHGSTLVPPYVVLAIPTTKFLSRLLTAAAEGVMWSRSNLVGIYSRACRCRNSAPKLI